MVIAITVALGAGCSGSHAVLAPHGPDAARTANLSWFMFGLAALITAFVFVLLVVGLFRDGTASGSRKINEGRLIIGGGVIMPAIVLITLSGLTVFALKTDPASAQGDVDITVVGHQYWWEIHYPGAGSGGSDVVTANEIHIPVDQTVRFKLVSADVIHSFWVPDLGGKTDMIPGHVNYMTLKATSAGTFRGECAQFCGLEHSRMSVQVVSQPEAEFHSWLAAQARSADLPTGNLARTGEADFESQSCAGCHTIRGTSAHGTQGPDLTHLASRSTLGALTVPNDRAHLEQWIVDAQAAKPGALMPAIPLDPSQARAITAYLEQLR